MKKLLIAIIVIVIILCGYFFFAKKPTPNTTQTTATTTRPNMITSDVQAQAEISNVENDIQSTDLSGLDEDFSTGLQDALK